MAVGGLDNVTNPEDGTPTEEKAPRPSTEEVAAQRESELAAEREEHNRRTNTGLKEY